MSGEICGALRTEDYGRGMTSQCLLELWHAGEHQYVRFFRPVASVTRTEVAAFFALCASLGALVGLFAAVFR